MEEQNFELNLFKEPLITEQKNGICIKLIGWYNVGDHKTMRGYLQLGEDQLDFIMGVPKENFKNGSGDDVQS